MTTSDVSTLTSSAQIFSGNTLPQIRAIHKALHVQVDDKAARLRTQVGGSYRELLGTADIIVRMRGDMDGVQSTLSQMGGRCGRAMVGAKVAGLGKFERTSDVAGTVDAVAGDGVLARAKLLGACVLVVGRALRPGAAAAAAAQGVVVPGEEGQPQGQSSRGDRLLLAAKVLVLSRLLIKSLGDETKDLELAIAVERSKKSLGTLRGKLLRSVDKVLESMSEQWKQQDILKALGAYSLATNSGAKDVLRHFLHIRGDAMVLAFEIEESERERNPADVVKCMGLYTKTILAVQGLAPHKLSDALLSLKKSALLADGSLRQVGGLRLDIYERWCGDEIQYFTPFIRHDDLDSSQAKEMLGSWATKGGEILLQGLEKTLDRMTEFKAIVELRTTVLKLWISDGGRAKGFDPSVMLTKLRDVINKRMLAVLDQKVNKLRIVGSEVLSTLDAWRDGSSNRYEGLWDEGSIDTDLGNGAAHFTHDVIARLYGRNDAVSKAVACYNSWHHIVDDVSKVVEQLRRHRWDNDIDEIEDEETIDERQALLSKADPQILHDHLNSALVLAFRALDEQLAALWKSNNQEGSRSGQVAMYLIRILRDIRAQLPKLDGLQAFGLSLVPSLHQQMIAAVATAPLSEFTSNPPSTQKLVGRSLWEGDPELPSTPSPGMFRFLRAVLNSMADAGVDLWSPPAVRQLKQHLAAQFCQAFSNALEEHRANGEASPKAEPEQEPAPESGNDDGDKNEDTAKTEEVPENSAPNGVAHPDTKLKRDLLIQWLFDVYYLRCSFSVPSPSTTKPFNDLADRIYGAAELDSAEAQERLIKASQEYWKRTSLLFGLLA